MAKVKQLAKITNQPELATPEERQRYYATTIAHELGVMGLRQRAIEYEHDPSILMDNVRDYIQLCYESGRPPTIEGFYTALGITRQTASLWRLSQRHKNDKRYREIIEYVDAYCSMNLSQLMIENKILPGTGIFWQKNHDGYQDDPHPQEAVEEDEERSAAEIREQYKYLIDDDDPVGL